MKKKQLLKRIEKLEKKISALDKGNQMLRLQKVTRHGIRYKGVSYIDFELAMYMGQTVAVYEYNGLLDIVSESGKLITRFEVL